MTLYYKIRQILLKNATTILLQNVTKVYYKMRQVLYYKMRKLLQKVLFITKCVDTRTLSNVYDGAFFQKQLTTFSS